jgi:hypothetical protein
MNGFGQPAFGTSMPWGATATLSPTIQPPSLAHAVFGSPAPALQNPFNDSFQQGQLLAQLLDELKRPRLEPPSATPRKKPTGPEKPMEPVGSGYGAPPEMPGPGWGGLIGGAEQY